MLKKGRKYLCKESVIFFHDIMKRGNFYQVINFDENVVYVEVNDYCRIFITHSGFDNTLNFFDHFYTEHEERAIKLKKISSEHIL